MKNIYHYTGLIVFWFVVVAISFCLLYLLWLGITKLWSKIKSRTWLYQTYEMIRAKRKYVEWQKENFKEVNWEFAIRYRRTFDNKKAKASYKNLHKKFWMKFLEDLLEFCPKPWYIINQQDLKPVTNLADMYKEAKEKSIELWLNMKQLHIMGSYKLTKEDEETGREVSMYKLIKKYNLYYEMRETQTEKTIFA